MGWRRWNSTDEGLYNQRADLAWGPFCTKKTFLDRSISLYSVLASDLLFKGVMAEFLNADRHRVLLVSKHMFKQCSIMMSEAVLRNPSTNQVGWMSWTHGARFIDTVVSDSGKVEYEGSSY
ncbi:unnamed protein product [Ilex paraguariensis]|uniref:Uncharacterized protein n=1 Tax=Ilex paraguariensis TaxID=185542 RepID=A0ABC8RH15_9AQUA